jgi:hypothetical protein
MTKIASMQGKHLEIQSILHNLIFYIYIGGQNDFSTQLSKT